MRPRRSNWPLTAFALTLSFGSLVAAPQEARAEKAKIHLERADVSKYPLLKLYLTFVEADGHISTGKTKENFKLIFDSNEQGVAADAKSYDQMAAEPIFVVMVAQVSGAMHEVFDDEKKGIKAIAQAAGAIKGSKVGLIGYAQDTKRVAELGKPDEIDGAASGLVEDTEGTEVHLLDAVRTAIDLLNAKGVPDEGRKLIVVFSDGIDVGGMDKKGFADLGKKAVTANIVIDTVGYAPFEPGKLKSLFEMSKQTNGTERICKSTQEVGTQFANISDEIGKQYVTLFQSIINGDGKEHTIQVVSEGGGAVYSNNITKTCLNSGPPVDNTPFYKKWWFLLICGILIVGLIALLVLWFINREPAPAPQEEAPAPAPVAAAPAPSAEPQRTMAIDVGSINRTPSVAWIVGMTGKYQDKTYKLSARTVIGTSTEADIQIEDPKCSRKHCEIRAESTGFRIVDLGSTNGVVLNDKKTSAGELIDGDLFRLGGTEFKFKAIN